MPVIDLDRDSLEELAGKSTGIGLTVPGVQKKLSLHLSDEGSSRLTLVGHPTGYILKPQTEDFAELPEAEDLVMDIADMMGVKTVPHGLVDINGEPAFITKRVDRMNGQTYAMEDFCQIGGRLTEDKYKGSYERCAGMIRKYSSRVGFDLSEFYLRLLVCFVTGNSDMHLKNFSLIEWNPGGRDFVLAPAYDLLPVNVIMPEDPEETALTLNGKKARLRRQDFLALAENAGVPRRAAERMIMSVVNKVERAADLCDHSTLSPERKAALITFIRERCGRLAG
jgi:serine/threonine-protein kinase HipA